MRTIMVYSYQWSLVAFSVIIAVFASYTTLRLAFRLVWAHKSALPYWIVGGAMSMGIGIWAMHFVGMMAMHLPVPVAYDPTMTALSVVPAILASAIALLVLSRPGAGAATHLAAAVLMGLGIIAMHYSGMAAMQMKPPIVYDHTLLALSVAVAIGASWLALFLVFQERSKSGMPFWRRLLSAITMGLAVSGMHYTGMAAAGFAPDAVCSIAATGLSGQALALSVGLVAVLVLAASLALTFYDEVAGENSFYKALLEAQSDAGEGVLLIEQDRVIYANRAIETLCGYSEAQIKSMPKWNELVEEASKDLLTRKAGRSEVLLVSRDGGLRPCDVVVASFLHAQATRHLVVCHDITQRVATQEALRASDEQARELALVAARTDNAVIISDARGHITWVNDGFERMSGYSMPEVLGQKPGHVLQGPGTDPNTVRQISDQLARAEGVKTEIINFHKAGRPYWVSLDIQPVCDEGGQVVKFIAIERDVTEKKQAEQTLVELNESLERRVSERTAQLSTALEQLKTAQADLIQSEKMASLGALVAGISHEINTPIGNSLTVASTLQDQAKGFAADVDKGLTRRRLDLFVAGVAEGTDILVRSLNVAVRLVSSFKQVAVDQTSVNRRAFQLRGVVEETLATLGPTLRRTTHTVACNIPAHIQMDSYPGPIGQIISNLISNALLHAFDGREHCNIQITAAEIDGGLVELVVQDDGAGIAAGHLARVFDPFFTTKLGKGGSGLGLNIVYNLVANTLGGRIKVESVIGQGACFTISLPLQVHYSDKCAEPKRDVPEQSA
jgi:PAS domain S-box-containing protein